mmetsp:Transcript_65119/g.182079  ORF Transcript_65119/g.182079 Transcript_65119/m.182079 type:complete len:321 (+) Transcript_65119:58-1020(+)
MAPLRLPLPPREPPQAPPPRWVQQAAQLLGDGGESDGEFAEESLAAEPLCPLERPPPEKLIRLRRILASCSTLAIASVILQFWQLAHAWRLVARRGGGSLCRELENWLVEGTAVLTVFQLYMWSCTTQTKSGLLYAAMGAGCGPLSVIWALWGVRKRRRLPAASAAQLPQLWRYIAELLGFGVGTSLGAIAGLALAHSARQLLREAAHDDKVESILRWIGSGSPVGASPGRQCSICLQEAETDNEGEGDKRLRRCACGGESSWRKTTCGHKFHGDCLAEWACGHATCPLCRLELHTPLQTPRAEEPSQLPAAMEGNAVTA